MDKKQQFVKWFINEKYKRKHEKNMKNRAVLDYDAKKIIKISRGDK